MSAIVIGTSPQLNSKQKNGVSEEQYKDDALSFNTEEPVQDKKRKKKKNKKKRKNGGGAESISEVSIND